eukprot:30835-Pelagococcus_subviridis.AAC.21
MVKHVVSLHRLRAELRRPEDEVDPLVDARGYRLAFESLAHDADELVGAAFRPRREFDVADGVAVLARPEVVRAVVFEKLREAVKLRDELFHIRGGLQTRAPAPIDGREQPIGVIEPPTLKLTVQPGERLEAKEEEQHDPGRGVVRAVVKRRRRRVRILREELKPLDELFQTRRVQRADRLREVSKHLRVVQVNLRGRVVAQYPREHRVLREVILRSPGERVQRLQVVKRRELSSSPTLLRSRRSLELTPAVHHDRARLARGDARRGLAHRAAVLKREEHGPAVGEENLNRDVSQLVPRVMYLVDPRRRPPPEPLLRAVQRDVVDRRRRVLGVVRLVLVRDEVHRGARDLHLTGDDAPAAHERPGRGEENLPSVVFR